MLCAMFSCSLQAWLGAVVVRVLDSYIRLQSVQNCTVRYILKAPPLSPSVPPLHQLHWLPIESRIC